MLMIQTELVCDGRTMVTWLPRDPRVKVGSVLTLDGKIGEWTVTYQSPALDASSIPRGWSVGGLDN